MTHTVLLVDDDANVLFALARALREQPYQLYTARSGEEAVAMLKIHRVDVVVADQRMPGMSGCDLLAWVAKNCPEVMRIMLTGNASTDSAIRAINEASVYQFFTKPCNDAHLAVAIRKALEHKDLLGEHSRLLELNRQQSRRLELFHQDLEILTRIIFHDLQEPLELIAQSCRSLAENCRDVFDPKTAAVVHTALDAVGEVQRLLLKLLKHVRNHEPAGSGDEPGAGLGPPDCSAQPQHASPRELLTSL
jgi:response regulator RpfG family c-di-GMP phosphodiesterase